MTKMTQFQTDNVFAKTAKLSANFMQICTYEVFALKILSKYSYEFCDPALCDDGLTCNSLDS